MTKLFHIVLFVLALLLSNKLIADDKPVKFNDPALEQRYYELIHEVRCLVCQNQSLADSNADLAQDLRHEIYQMLNEGKQNAAIYQFLTERYGDFVLYNPPLQKNTWLLWFGPFLLLLISIVLVVIIIKRQSNKTTKEISEEEQKQLMAILNNKSNKDGS